MKKVLILGRPNVGKSTLFNRLVGKRLAITEDRPGVTRDILTGIAEWRGRAFLLQDSGGVPHVDPEVRKQVEERVEQAIREADLLLLLVDARTGPTTEDRALARRLRATGKKVLLAVNKVDSVEWEPDAYAFQALGLGEPRPVSAESGYRLGDLLDAILEELEDSGSEEEVPIPHIGLVGRRNVGKSTLLNTLAGAYRAITSPQPGTTRDPVSVILEHEGKKFRLTDTAGLRLRRHFRDDLEFYAEARALRLLKDLDLALLVLDAQEGITRTDRKIGGLLVEEGIPLILVVNKWDLLPENLSDRKARKQFLQLRNESARFLDFAPVVFVSALRGEGLEHLWSAIHAVLAWREKRVPTPALNRILEGLRENYSHLIRYGKIHYGTQTSRKPVVFTLFSSHPDEVEKGFLELLEREIRTHFPFPGVPFRFVLREKKNPASVRRTS